MRDQQKTKEQWVAEGIRLYENKDFQQALAACEQALLLDKNYARALHGKGLSLMALGRYEEALTPLQRSIHLENLYSQDYGKHAAKRLQALGEVYQQLIKSQPRYRELYVRQTESFINTVHNLKFSSNRYIFSKSNTLVVYEYLLLFNPESDLIHIEMGRLLFDLGKYKESGEAFNRAVSINPKHKEAYARRTQELLARKDFLGYEEIIREPFSDALQFNPSSGQVQVARGKDLFQQEKYAESGEVFKQAIELDAQYQQLYDDLYISLLNKGQEVRRRHYYRSAIAFCPQKPQAYADLGEFLYEAQSYKAAGDAYRQGCKLDPALLHIYKDRMQTLLMLSEKYTSSQQCSKAFNVVKAACQFYPSHPLPHLYHGRLLLEQGVYEQADVEYRKAIELDPTLKKEYDEQVQRLGEKVDVLLKQQHYEQAKQTSKQILHFYPQSTYWQNKIKGYIDQGKVYIKQNNWQEALNAFERALLLTENDPNLYIRLGEILLHLGRYGEAGEAYKHAIDLDRNYIQIYIDQKNQLLFQASEQYKIGHKQKACSIYEKIIIFYPRSADAFAYYGKTLYELQKYTEAGSAYNRAIHLSAGKQQEYEELMELLLNKGEDLSRNKSYEEALKIYENAISFNPKHVQTQLKYADLLYKTERFEEAGKLYKSLVKIYKDAGTLQERHCRDLKEKGKILFARKRHKDALLFFENATCFDPTDREAYLLKSDVLEKLGRDQEALWSRKKADAISGSTNDSVEKGEWLYKEPFRYD